MNDPIFLWGLNRMKTKYILVIATVVAILGALYFVNRGRVQGFQNPSEPTFTMY